MVDELNSNDDEHLNLLSRPELGVTFTKLNCWLLTQFSKCVFLDADCLVLKNIDDLFEREELSAAPDAGWPDCFNSGVFVFRPSKETYRRLMLFASQRGASFDGLFFNGFEFLCVDRTVLLMFRWRSRSTQRILFRLENIEHRSSSVIHLQCHIECFLFLFAGNHKISERRSCCSLRWFDEAVAIDLQHRQRTIIGTIWPRK